jgi:hypothetical protein
VEEEEEVNNEKKETEGEKRRMEGEGEIKEVLEFIYAT